MPFSSFKTRRLTRIYLENCKVSPSWHVLLFWRKEKPSLDSCTYSNTRAITRVLYLVSQSGDTNPPSLFLRLPVGVLISPRSISGPLFSALSHSEDGPSVTTSLPEELLLKPAVDKDGDIKVTPAERRHLSRSFRLLAAGFFLLEWFFFFFLYFISASLFVLYQSRLVFSEGLSPSIKEQIITPTALIF